MPAAILSPECTLPSSRFLLRGVGAFLARRSEALEEPTASFRWGVIWCSYRLHPNWILCLESESESDIHTTYIYIHVCLFAETTISTDVCVCRCIYLSMNMVLDVGKYVREIRYKVC